jgi:hypothetical protein
MVIPVQHAQALYALTKAFVDVNFPDYSWRAKFGACACGKDRLPPDVRNQNIALLADKEAVDRTQTVWQFQCAVPHLERFYAQHGDNRTAWAAVLQHCCLQKGKCKPDAACIFQLGLTYLGIMDGASDVERMFARLDLCEAKRSARHHDADYLHHL